MRFRRCTCASQVNMRTDMHCESIHITLAHAWWGILFHFANNLLALRDCMSLRYVRVINTHLWCRVENNLIRALCWPISRLVFVRYTTNFFTLWSYRLLLEISGELTVTGKVDDSLSCVWFRPCHLVCMWCNASFLVFLEILLLLKLFLLEILH